jgi:phospholipid/cholesterol/gamma-HCH transport system ATP-binding protein
MLRGSEKIDYNNPVIQVRDLTVGYGDFVILENLNFEIYQGEVFVILGGSGCGKSSTLKNLIGLYSPLKGEILIKGKSVTGASEEEMAELTHEFGVLYQSAALFSSLTLGENVALTMHEFTDYSPEVIKSLVNVKLGLVALDEFEDFFPSEISGGMKKRAGLARAMALDPDMLFFDEPSAGLDPISSAELDSLILDLREQLGTTMVIVTHELDSIFSIADRVIILDQHTKSIVEQGDPRELRDHSKNDWVRKFLNRASMRG